MTFGDSSSLGRFSGLGKASAAGAGSRMSVRTPADARAGEVVKGFVGALQARRLGDPCGMDAGEPIKPVVVVEFNHMVTVPEAARRTGKNPETIRRWIRSGKLRARRIGTQHVIEEQDLESALDEPQMLRLPRGLRRTFWGAPMPNVVAWIRVSRRGH